MILFYKPQSLYLIQIQHAMHVSNMVIKFADIFDF